MEVSLDRDIILTDNFHQFPLKPFCVMAGSTALAAIPVCCELGPMHSSSMYTVNIKFLLAIFKEGTGNVFLQPADIHHIL
jgi:hypothetical protein